VCGLQQYWTDIPNILMLGWKQTAGQVLGCLCLLLVGWWDQQQAVCCCFHLLLWSLLLGPLQVLARSSPEDKLTLVSLLKKEGEVVAVTGESGMTLVCLSMWALTQCSPSSMFIGQESTTA